MILGTRHTGIVVQDMEKSLRFWRDIMGLKVQVDFREKGEFIDTVQHLKGVDLRMIKLAAPDGTLIELLKDDAHPTPVPTRNDLCDCGIRHIAFTVADVDQSWKTLKDYGGEVLSPPTVSPDKKARLFFTRDPEGNLLEIVQMIPAELPHRRIVSPIPHPESLSLIRELAEIEPHSMSGFPPVVWDRAEGFRVFDPYGNIWIDFTSSVVLASAGHANPRIARALRGQIDAKLWHCYCNPSRIRLDTVKALKQILPPYLDKVFLLSTGTETTEAAIKLMRLHGRKRSPEKYHVVSFFNSFHGRTMGAQSIGGFLDQQEWMGQKPPGFHHIPFPECARCPWGRSQYEHCGRECFEKAIQTVPVPSDQVAGVITETFQGPTVAFMPEDFARALREWCNQHEALLAFDEMQAGFGRTGQWFGFEHYGIEADLICLGKGMTSSVPMSALAGRGPVLDLAEHGQMSSTHTGNPICCAATIANIEAIRDDGLMENALRLEPVVRERLDNLKKEFPARIGTINGKGLVWAVYLVNPQTKALDVDFAQRVTTRGMELGLLMLQTGRGTLKIAPPLCITREALLEGFDVIAQAVGECQ